MAHRISAVITLSFSGLDNTAICFYDAATASPPPYDVVGVSFDIPKNI
jgi:hypothetical protein